MRKYFTDDDTINRDIREAIVKSGLFFWQVAKRCDISAGSLSRWLREPLDENDPRRTMILNAINQDKE